MEVASAALLQREILLKWDEIRGEFDFDNNACITPTEFVHGMKRAALRFPIDAQIAARGRPDSSHLEYLTLLTESVNHTIKNLCKLLFEYLASVQKDAQKSLQRVQAQVYAARSAAGLPTSVPQQHLPTRPEEQLMMAQQQMATLHYAFVGDPVHKRRGFF